MTPPEPLEKQLPRVAMLGAVVGIAGILLFVVLWMVLEGQPNTVRLFVSLCLPPGIMALLVGGYMLVSRPR